jgi:hypothetical protein
MRIALIHALAHSKKPINVAFQKLWPEAQLMNILDDSLSRDLSDRGYLDSPMHRRFDCLATYAIDNGADAVLFTCSAFGSCIDAVKLKHGSHRHILKPNEAMIEEALKKQPKTVGLLATFHPTLSSMKAEFYEANGPDGARATIRTAFAAGAMKALDCGDTEAHDEIACRVAVEQLGDCDIIALAQYSLARAAPRIRVALPGATVLTTTDSSVLKMKALLTGI